MNRTRTRSRSRSRRRSRGRSGSGIELRLGLGLEEGVGAESRFLRQPGNWVARKIRLKSRKIVYEILKIM